MSLELCNKSVRSAYFSLPIVVIVDLGSLVDCQLKIYIPGTFMTIL